MIEWTFDDQAAAAAEGWDIFATGGMDGHPPLEIQRIDSPEEGEGHLVDDMHAWALVWTKALAGSRLHGKALAILALESPEELNNVMKGAVVPT